VRACSGDHINSSAAKSARRDRRDPQGRRAKRDAADVIIYFANITRWNTRAVEYMAVKDAPMGSAHLVCVAETHLRGPRLTQEIKTMYKAGWRAAVVPSVETPNAQHSGPGHGGVAIFAQKRLHVRPLTSKDKEAIQEDGSKGVQTQWTATELRLQGVDLIVICIYLAPEYGLSGSNWATLSEAADFLHEHGKPFIMVGDFNNTVEELQPTGLDKYLGAVWRRPKGQVPGDHRPIDLVLATASLATHLVIDWDVTSPWAQPHTGFTIRLPRRLLTMQMRVLESPLGHQESYGPDLPWDWHLARAEAALQPGWQRLPAHRWPHLQYSDQVDRQYMLFCLAAESVQASRQCQAFEEAAFHRGWPVEIKVVPVAPPRPQGWRCRPTGLSAWMALKTRLADLVGVLRKRTAAVPEHLQALRGQLGRVRAAPLILNAPEEKYILTCIQAICDGSEENMGARRRTLEDGLTSLTKVTRRQATHLLGLGRRGYQRWVKDCLGDGAGALHRLTKTWGEPIQELAAEHDEQGRALLRPDDVVTSKAAMWGHLWRSTSSPTTPAWMEPLRRAAAQQAGEEITEEQLDAAMSCFSRRVGQGADCQNPRWWRSLPAGAHQHLIILLTAIEDELVWPTAMTLNIVQLIHKGVEADRPITLTQGLYRLWSRIRRRDVAAWTQEHAGHWDRAVAGSAPLRAALIRQAKLELATVQRFSWVEVLWDLTKFYDFVDLQVVADVGLAQSYPIVSLALGLEMAAAPRRIRADGCISECLVPTRSLIAGCGQAVDFSRLALYEVLDHLHAKYRPLELSSWVDDLGHQEVGHTSSVASRAIGVSTELVTGLQAKGFKMSSKSALLASSPDLGRKVQAALAAAGIEVHLS
jgi:hypothetical protein